MITFYINFSIHFICLDSGLCWDHVHTRYSYSTSFSDQLGMNGDELLHSKYDRLCVEFKKLRNKHREYRENTSKELSVLQSLKVANPFFMLKCILQSSEKEKDLRISNLERECDNLRFSNAYLSKQLELMTSHSKSGSGESSNLRNEACMDKSVSCITGCSDTNSARVQDHISDGTPSQIHQLLSDLVTALREWTAAILSEEKRMNFAEADAYLIDQVARLERQVGELSLQCQLERKRRLMNTEQPNNQIPNRPEREQGTTGLFSATEASDCSAVTTLDSFEQRIHALTEQTYSLIALVSFLKDEVSLYLSYLNGR
ncbi:hypothetical protein PHET_09858 [Paragonimus heterotremus]|uniref:Uncharacterized protein n=1 Tax=Paragonimus heterotremus TaxID=100268 RepID=A0A8J4WEJ2_9TREM|nr:hypothetical protein PHET_09858 [Paragonimus heterotremus]